MIDKLLQKQLRDRFNPDGSLLRQHQLRMLDMLRYIDAICRKHNIKYWLCSGTLIGAVRHGGFIPWDDDVDIEMLREDYEKFVKVMATEPQTDYMLQTHETDKEYFFPFAKLRDLHSYAKEDNSSDLYFKFRGIYIDILIIDPSSSYILSRLGSILYGRLLLWPNNKLGRFRKLYYTITYPLIYKFFFPCIRWISRYNSKGRYRIALGSHFFKPRFYCDLFPLKRLPFEDVLLPVPHNYDEYLKKIYGEYMQVPNINKLPKHFAKVEIFKH